MDISQLSDAQLINALKASGSPPGNLNFDDLIPKSGGALGTKAKRTGMFDDIPTAPAQSSGMFDDIPVQRSGSLDFSDLIPKRPDLSSMSDADLLKAIGRQPEDVSTVGDIAKSGGIGLAKGVIGLAGLPADLANVAARGVDYVAGTNLQRYTQPFQNEFGGQRLLSETEKATGAFYQPKTTAGQYAQTIGEFAPAVIGGPETLATKFATRVAAPAISSETAGQLTQGTPLEPFARVGGAIAGAGLPGVLSRAVSPATISPERQAAVTLLKNEGVPLDAGAVTGSKAVGYIQSELGDALGAGGQATKSNAATMEGFTAAALRRAGVQGETRATPEVMDAAFTDNSNAFNSVAARNPAIPVSQSFWTDIGKIQTDYENLTGQPSKLLQQFEDRLKNPSVSPTKLTPSGYPATISGAAYQDIQSDMARFARATSQPELKMALYDTRASLDGAIGQGLKLMGNAPDASAWQQARGQYKNLLVLEKAVSGTGEQASAGLITPAALGQADRQISGMRQYVRGTSNFSDLAHAGNMILKALPQSGTAPRAAAHAMAGIGGAAIGGHFGGIPGVLAGLVGPAVMGRALYTRPVQAYLKNQKGVGLRQVPLRQNALTGGVLALPGANGQ